MLVTLDGVITTLIFIINSPARVFGGTVDIKSKNSIKFCQKINHGYQRSLHFWHGLWAGRKSLVISDYHHFYGKILRFWFMIFKQRFNFNFWSSNQEIIVLWYYNSSICYSIINWFLSYIQMSCWSRNANLTLFVIL